MMWYGGPGSWVGWLIMSLMMVLFWGAIIALVVWLIRSSRSDGAKQDHVSHSDALSILRERFARGEIDAKEYQERARVLESSSPSAGS
jgi:putative membrane protein